MDYWHKIEQNPYPELSWNIPETKQGSLYVFGGNINSFNTEIKISEFIAKNSPVKDLKIVLPDSIKSKLPPVDNFLFLPSTENGTFADSEELKSALNIADSNLILGDFSKNSITKKAVWSACVSAEKPTLITRDTIDLIAEENPEQLLMNENLIFFTTMPSLQKLFRAVYYPKVLLLTQPIMQIVEALHKFTLSYPISIITFSNEKILIAKNGNVFSTPLQNYSPLTMWNGELAAKIAIMNLYNPNNFEKATINALF